MASWREIAGWEGEKKTWKGGGIGYPSVLHPSEFGSEKRKLFVSRRAREAVAAVHARAMGGTREAAELRPA